MQRKRHIKIELCVRLSVLRSFHVDNVVQNRRIALRLLGTNGFHVKAKSERFTAASSRRCHNIKEVLASTTGTATTTPQTKNLIGLVWKNNCAARAARSYEQVRAVLCKKTT